MHGCEMHVTMAAIEAHVNRTREANEWYRTQRRQQARKTLAQLRDRCILTQDEQVAVQAALDELSA